MLKKHDSEIFKHSHFFGDMMETPEFLTRERRPSPKVFDGFSGSMNKMVADFKEFRIMSRDSETGTEVLDEEAGCQKPEKPLIVTYGHQSRATPTTFEEIYAWNSVPVTYQEPTPAAPICPSRPLPPAEILPKMKSNFLADITNIMENIDQSKG